MIKNLQKEFELRMKDECLHRINKCLDLMSEESIWYSPNKHVNSVGNLVLHLCGNIGQYIQTALGNEKDTRQRDKEFSAIKSHNREELKASITKTILGAVAVVHNVDENKFKNDINVQCFSMNGLSIIIHVIEHTSYHTGQITQMCKWLQEVDTNYYPNMDLNKTT